VVKCERKRDRDFNKSRLSLPAYKNQKRGGVVISQVAVYEDVAYEAAVQQEAELAVEQQGFSTEDILWALGIWSVILCMSPVIVFYMLMVA